MGALQLLSLWLQQLTDLRRSSCPRALSRQSWWRDGCSRWQRGRGRRGRPRWGGPPGWWTSSSGRGVVWALHNAELHNAKLQNCTIAQCTLEKSTIAQLHNAHLPNANPTQNVWAVLQSRSPPRLAEGAQSREQTIIFLRICDKNRVNYRPIS